jgi:hypothetical protein
MGYDSAEVGIELPPVTWSLKWQGANSETDLERAVFLFSIVLAFKLLL